MLLALSLPVSLSAECVAERAHFQVRAEDGSVSEFQFINPQSFVYLRVVGADGKEAFWHCEMASRSVLERNSYRIVRLKDKLGTKSMASGEIIMDGAVAYLVGDVNRGFKQMMGMVNVSRLSNAMRAAGASAGWQHVKMRRRRSSRTSLTGARSSSSWWRSAAWAWPRSSRRTRSRR